jgi:nucleoside-diphosphate-sugar epimerase
MAKNAILILGMHRSGTSALGGVINIFGAYMGQNMMPPKDNEKGYFENIDINNLNEYILGELQSSWHDIRELVIDFDDAEFSILMKYVMQTTFRLYPENLARPEKNVHFKGDSSKLKDVTGWKPEYTFETLIDEMIEHYKLT